MQRYSGINCLYPGHLKSAVSVDPNQFTDKCIYKPATYEDRSSGWNGGRYFKPPTPWQVYVGKKVILPSKTTSENIGRPKDNPGYGPPRAPYPQPAPGVRPGTGYY